VRKGALSAAEHRARGAHLNGDTGTGRFLPLVGRIQAGRPLLSDENFDGEVFVSSEFTPPGRAFVLRVHGDSMEGAGILDGDLVVVRQSSAAIPGKIVAVTIDGESTLKILHRDGEAWKLVSANSKYSPIEIRSPAVIHGQVTAVLRKLTNKPHRDSVAEESLIRMGG
jgi:repressor LexA